MEFKSYKDLFEPLGVFNLGKRKKRRKQKRSKEKDKGAGAEEEEENEEKKGGEKREGEVHIGDKTQS